MTKVTSFSSTPGVERQEARLLSLVEQHQVLQETAGASPTEIPPDHHAVKATPYARVERTTTRRTKRLGPALSLSTTRRIYPDEESIAGF